MVTLDDDGDDSRDSVRNRNGCRLSVTNSTTVILTHSAGGGTCALPKLISFQQWGLSCRLWCRIYDGTVIHSSDAWNRSTYSSSVAPTTRTRMKLAKFAVFLMELCSTVIRQNSVTETKGEKTAGGNYKPYLSKCFG